MNNSSNKLISIIMPTYNVEHYITQTIQSILSQNSSNYKLIIVDDHSTDKTVEIINKEFLQEISNNKITIINLDKNSGPSRARQIGLKNIDTPYVTFIDSDDLYLSTNVISLLETSIKRYNPDCIMYKYITDHGKIKIKKNYSLPEHTLISNRIALIQKIKKPHPIWHYIWNKCYRTDIIKNNHISFQEKLRVAEDVCFNEEFLLHCKRLLFINQYLYLYNCINSQSISKVNSSKKRMTLNDCYQQFKHECSQFEKTWQYTRMLECEKECANTLKYNLCSAIARLMIKSKEYSYHKELKRLIQESPYFLQVKHLYTICYITNIVKLHITHLKSIIKAKL